jgi:hypothetical protein
MNGMTKPDTNLRIVNVMDPIMCLRCTSAHIAEVLFTDGTKRKMFYCSRLDCDNWNGAKDVPPDEAALDEAA